MCFKISKPRFGRAFWCYNTSNLLLTFEVVAFHEKREGEMVDFDSTRMS